ncbi:MAG: cytochrome bc complex cytochrome b subunit [Euryarchaeota archaeon]|nr:cytochrome bc complex cytochrome b subunit [Euryarchaeota archaeon]
MALFSWEPGRLKNPLYWLSAVSATCLIVLTLTGAVLALWYEPAPERAYGSMVYIQRYVHFGDLLLALHHWATHLLLVSIILHLLRVFYMGTYRGRMGTAWVTSALFLVVAVLFVFSGYLLRWDELGYWSVRVTASIVGYTPLVGRGLENFILGGGDITSRTLARFYLWHIGILPLAALLLLGYHYYLINKRKIYWAEVGVGFIVLGFLVMYSVLQPFALGPEPSPELQTTLKPIWLFLWLYSIERSLPPGLNFLNILILLALLAFVTFLPYLDRGDDPRWRLRVAVPLLAVLLLLSLVGYLWDAPLK